ncbi:MAG TPA: hypothetical protein VM580_25140 [Labilithrix sp.]|nr:hypothetical protein [Labilithrix sp.]
MTIAWPPAQSIVTVGTTPTITAIAGAPPEFFVDGVSMGVGYHTGGGRFTVDWRPESIQFDVVLTAKLPDGESTSIHVAVAEDNHIERDLSKWTRAHTTVTPGEADPNGRAEAFRVTCAATAGAAVHSITASAVAANTEPDPGFEIWAKADTASVIQFLWQEDGTKHRASLDLSTGHAVGAWGSVKIVESRADGWKRIWFRSLGGTMTQSTMSLSVCKALSSSCSNTTTGDESVYLYAPRVVDGPLPFTPYQLATPSYVGVVNGAQRWAVRTPYVDKIADTTQARFADIVVPDDYDPEREYPVLYVGEVEAVPKQYADGLQELRALDVHNAYQCILARTYFGTIPMWYGSHVDGTKQYDVQVTDVLVGLVDEFYSTVRSSEGRMFIGFSKSGFGAFSLILRNPHVFGYAAAWDAPWTASYGFAGSAQAFGAESQFDLYNPMKLLPTHGAHLKDRPRLVLAGDYLYDDDIQPMADALDAEGIPYVLRSETALGHDWDTGWLPAVVQDLMALRPEPEAP